jgi:hypothetical protein
MPLRTQPGRRRSRSSAPLAQTAAPRCTAWHRLLFQAAPPPAGRRRSRSSAPLAQTAAPRCTAWHRLLFQAAPPPAGRRRSRSSAPLAQTAAPRCTAWHRLLFQAAPPDKPQDRPDSHVLGRKRDSIASDEAVECANVTPRAPPSRSIAGAAPDSKASAMSPVGCSRLDRRFASPWVAKRQRGVVRG